MAYNWKSKSQSEQALAQIIGRKPAIIDVIVYNNGLIYPIKRYHFVTERKVTENY